MNNRQEKHQYSKLNKSKLRAKLIEKWTAAKNV